MCDIGMMDNPEILHFLLRDEEFDNLDQICNCFDVDRDEMDRILASEGYSYVDELNRVK